MEFFPLPDSESMPPHPDSESMLEQPSSSASENTLEAKTPAPANQVALITEAIKNAVEGRMPPTSSRTTPLLLPTTEFLRTAIRSPVLFQSVPCKCGICGSSHPQPGELTRKILKTWRLQKLISERTAKQVGADSDVPVDSSASLKKSLLRGVLRGFRSLDGSNPRSVIEHRQSLERLRHSGFRAEYKLLQMLHTAKLENQTRATSDKISKMLEQFHL